MGAGGSFPGGKAAGREADHSPPASAEVKKMWIYTSTPPYAFMALCLIRWAQGQIYFTFYLLKWSIIILISPTCPENEEYQ
jgi:hypothetical protein